jgi:hypothetical protein
MIEARSGKDYTRLDMQNTNENEVPFLSELLHGARATPVPFRNRDTRRHSQTCKHRTARRIIGYDSFIISSTSIESRTEHALLINRMVPFCEES